MKRAGIPENEREFYTKPELGLEIVRHARKNNFRFGWVGADAGYAKGPQFCNAPDEMSETLLSIFTPIFMYTCETRNPISQKKSAVAVVNLKSIRAIKKALRFEMLLNLYLHSAGKPLNFMTQPVVRLKCEYLG